MDEEMNERRRMSEWEEWMQFIVSAVKREYRGGREEE